MYLLAFCRKRPDVQALIRNEVAPLAGHGGVRTDEQDSNTTLPDDRGSTYTLRRLKRDNPELAERVASGKISANARPQHRNLCVQRLKLRPRHTRPKDGLTHQVMLSGHQGLYLRPGEECRIRLGLRIL